ncbi:MAG: alpha/beta hydrolase [Candidatus Sericytochromatia bacterium]|nr:alpha/beta hydrolase [Candidatus Tanganyikabacteria bacterium]
MPAVDCRPGIRPKGTLIRSGPHRVAGLPERHRITTYVPPGFDRSARAFPVAYLFDGQNIFSDNGSFRGGWQLHEHLDRRACLGQTVPIVVGIHTDRWSRTRILAPWSEEPAEVSLADRMLDWIVGPLAEMVAEEARVLVGPENTAIGGSSLGGLASLYAFFRHPDAFGKVMAMSPSLGISGGVMGPIYPYVQRAVRTGDGRIYLDAGGLECPCGHVLRQADEMAALLVRKGFELGDNLMWVPDPQGSHDEEHWSRRLPAALAFLFGAGPK